MSTLSIIIISYNTRSLTEQCLTSVFEELDNSPSLKEQTEVFVVDNNSSYDSVVMLESWHDRYPATFHLIKNTHNFGFAHANNQAIASSHGEFILLLNSDTVLKPNALQIMLDVFAAHPIEEQSSVLASHRGELDRLGILSASLLNPDGSDQPQGGSFPTLLTLGCHMLLLDDLPIIGRWLPSTQHTGRRHVKHAHQTIWQQDWVGGTAMMVRRAVFDEVDVLDQNIFMYAEDIELCLRARHHHWDVAVSGGSQITHFGSASSSAERAIVGELRGYLYIWSKHKPLWQLPLVRSLIWLGIRLRVFVFGTIKHDPNRVAVYRRAWRAVIE